MQGFFNSMGNLSGVKLRNLDSTPGEVPTLSTSRSKPVEARPSVSLQHGCHAQINALPSACHAGAAGGFSI